MSNNTISARMSETDKVLLEKVCESRQEDVSDFVRRAVRVELARLGFLTEQDRKALGL
jgi:uncharacterized protein (DUF1778 family)